MPNALLWLIPGAPLAAAVLITLFGKRWLRESSDLPCILGIGVSAVSSLLLLMRGTYNDAVMNVVGYEWFSVGDLTVPVALRVDSLTVMMLVMVTCVAFLVAIFARGYMHHDPGYPRFFAAVSLFVFSMTMLVLSSNLILLYVFWEAVGFCSYLLIGFWFQKPSAAAAAKKAFLVNRIGDFGFAIGIFLMWVLVGRALDWQAPPGQTLLDYTTIFQVAGSLAENDHGLLLAAALCLFAGAVGKSAQFPLHVWLPDAMEGPTPVSALIHAATMVTAGVYMVARLSPVYVHLPEAQVFIACIGGITALLAALIALTQYDLKRVLAYSTVSQLGLMFVALGAAAGDSHRMAIAGVAALFHLFTHAFFKALLFLGSGSVMHAMGNNIDMRKFSGLRHVMPITHWTFLIGALALAGIPPFSGFWSKDEILAVTGEAALHAAEPYRIYFAILQYAVLLTSLLTAFYVFRAYFLTFWGDKLIPREAGDHAHESPAVMTIPLVILAVCAAAIGGLLAWHHRLFDFLAHTPGLDGGEAHALSPAVMIMGSLVGVIGIVIAWFLYGRSRGAATQIAVQFPKAYVLSLKKFYFDEIYAALIVRPLEWLAGVSARFDKLAIDAVVDAVGRVPGHVGRWLQPWQNGLVQSYAVTMFMGITVLAVLVLLVNWT